ncbi:MAG: hypothetical protein FJ405_13985 [Verrucomicrobia bacterium]|nr:hypothetical protein [Verrucomicrobiota bacterium]
MNLTDAQKSKVAEWIQEGLKLSEIQNRLHSEFQARLTYMEVKMLLAELELRPKDQEVPKSALLNTPPSPASSSNPGQPQQPDPGASDQTSFGEDGSSQSAEDPLPPGGAGGGNVSVSVDTLTRAGAMVSGKVSFSDGKGADWYLDQYGRLGFAPAEKGYRPSQTDLMAFQTELQRQLAKFGY